MTSSTQPESTVAHKIYKILPCHNKILHAVYKYIKKMGFKSLVWKDVTFHSTFISHTQISGKLENILNKLLKKHSACSTSDSCMYIGPLKETTTHLSMFLNKDTPCGRENEGIQERSHDVLDVVDKKRDCVLVCFVQNIRYLVGTSDVTTISNDRGNILQISCKTLLEKTHEYCCVVQMHGSEHMWMFPVIPKRCCHFAGVQSFQFEFTTHLMYLQGKHLQSSDQKYNCRECGCYIIHIKLCFPRTNQWLFLHVLVICL